MQPSGEWDSLQHNGGVRGVSGVAGGLRLPAGPRIILPQVPSIKNWPRSNFKSLGIELLDLKQILSGRGGKTWDEKKDGKGLPFLDVRSVGSFAVFGTMGGPASR